MATPMPWRFGRIMVGLWLSVFGATITHFQLDTWAGLAFVPYLVWVTVAAALNLAMVRLNPNQKPLPITDMPVQD